MLKLLVKTSSVLLTIGFPSVPFSFETLKPGGNHTVCNHRGCGWSYRIFFDFIINAESGGLKSWLSRMNMTVFLVVGIVVFAPITIMTGFMFAVCQSTFSWSTIDGKVMSRSTAVSLNQRYATSL